MEYARVHLFLTERRATTHPSAAHRGLVDKLLDELTLNEHAEGMSNTRYQ